MSLNAQSIDQIKLYYVDGEQKNEIELGTNGSYHYTKEPFTVGNLTEGASYRFVLSSSRVISRERSCQRIC